MDELRVTIVLHSERGGNRLIVELKHFQSGKRQWKAQEVSQFEESESSKGAALNCLMELSDLGEINDEQYNALAEVVRSFDRNNVINLGAGLKIKLEDEHT